MKQAIVHSKVEALLYQLLRDHVAPGDLEQAVQEIEKSRNDTFGLSNGHLANYATELAQRINAIPR